MSAFSRVVSADARPAPRTITLAPEAFAEGFRNRPSSDIVVGIRVPSERDYRAANFEADKEDDDQKANQKIFDIVVSRGLCDPNNVNAEHPSFPVAEETVPIALKPRTIQRIYDEIERLAVEQSPVYGEASDADVADLWALLAGDDPFSGMAPLEASRCRRYLKFALEHFTAHASVSSD